MCKRSFLSILLILCMLLSVFALASCQKSGEDTTTAPETEPEATAPETTAEETTAATTARPAPEPNAYYSFYENQEYIKLLGRTRYYKNAVVVDWSAAGLEFEYEGSGDLKLTVEFSGDHNAVLEIDVDGKVGTVTVEESGTFRLASGLADGAHHVKIRRRTMVEDKAKGILLALQGVRMTGYFLDRPADNKYKVAFIGDSITCGVGLTGTNGLLTYAVDLCTREGFDYDVCSVSGIGVSHSTSKHGGTANTMAKYYPYFNYYRSETLRYYPDRQADLVIVNLNTNDNNTGATEAQYKEDLKTLISEIRAAHGENVPIVWVVGMMISPSANVNGWMNSVFAELGGESAGLYKIQVETNTAGGSSHPNQASHLAVSQALSIYLRTKNLLDLPPLAD